MTPKKIKSNDTSPLTLSQDMFEKVMDSLEAIVYVADMQTYEIIFANKYLQETTGATAGQICWQTIQGNRSGPCDFCSNQYLLDEKREPGGVHRWEHLNIINNRWYDIIDRAVYWTDGRLVRIEIATDITQRKQIEGSLKESNEKLNTLLKTSPDKIQVIDNELNVIYTNESEKDPKYVDMTKSHVLDNIARKYHARFRKTLDQVIADQNTQSFEMEDTGSRWWESSLAPVTIALNTKCAMLISRDISDRKKAEAFMKEAQLELEHRVAERTSELEQTYQQLIQSEKMAALGFLVSSIAHEINNPNSFITFNIPILREYFQEILPILDRESERRENLEICGLSYSEFREDILKLMDNIEHGSQRINSTISHLKEFVSPTNQAEFQLVSLKNVVEKAVELCRTQINKSAQSFDVEFSARFPKIRTVSQSLEQILINLLINAAQSLDKTESWVKLEVKKNNQNKSVFHIDVSDNGCGISEDHLEKIFEPFFTTKNKITGIGLGLNITKRLTEEIGGKIEVTSTTGIGSRFRLTLPL